MRTMDYDSFVFYGNWRTMLDGFDKETAKDILWQIMLYGTAGEVDTSNPMINGIVMGCCAAGIDKAKDRYANAVDNGKKGGRPTEIDAEHVRELKESGLTNKEIATELGCSTRTVERANRQNRQNLNININNNNNINNKDNSNITTNTTTNTNTTMNVNSVNSVNTITDDIKLAIIDMFRARNNYSTMQAKIKTDFDTDISFDDIKQIIDNRNTLEPEIKHKKATAPTNQTEQADYERFCEIIDALANKGIKATIDDVTYCYRFSRDNKSKPWTIDEMVNFINTENKQSFYDYVNAI